MSKNSVLKQIQEEPYRLFFPLGILIAVVGVGHWPVYAFGWIPQYRTYFHSSLQTQAYMTCFVVGFLMTAMPRFASAAHATKGELLRFLALIFGNVTALGLGQWIVAELCFVGILISLLLFAVMRIASRSQSQAVTPPLEFIWVPIAVLHGLTGSILMILIQTAKAPVLWFQTAKLMSEQGFILCIVIGVGGFLAPRLMGTFRTFVKLGQKPNDSDLFKIRRRILIFHLIAGALFFISFWLGAKNLQLAYFLRATIITAEYFWTCSFLRFPRTPEFYAKLLWLSLWMVVIGSWAAAFWPHYRIALLHIIFIGGFSLMIFSVATMVVLSHGGETEKMRRPLSILWIVGAGVLSSLSFRLAAAFYPEKYFPFLGVSGTLWIVTALLWFFFVLPKIFRALPGEELERCHEEAKKRVAQLRETNPDVDKGKCCDPKADCR